MDLTAAAGAVAVAELCLLLAILVEAPLAAGVAFSAFALLMGAADSADAGWPATPFEAGAFALAGVLFGRALGTNALVVALPVFIAGLALLLGGGDRVLAPGEGDGDLLTLALPGTDVALASVSAAFLGLYASWAWQRRFRLAPTALALVLALAVSAATEGAVPALVLVAVAFLGPNADLAWKAFRDDPDGQ